MSWIEVIILVVSGLFAGFINTLAGGGSLLTLSVLMFLGLPPAIANGTNRLAILAQTFAASSSFRKNKVLDQKKALILAVPALAGSIIGAYIAVDIDKEAFEKAFAIIMLLMLIFIFYKPRKYLYGREDIIDKKIKWWQVVLFFIIGIYGGFIQVGIGYFLLAAIVMGAGYDLVKANAIKVTITLFITIFALIIFLIHAEVSWIHGLVMAAGSYSGGLIASRLAVKKGVAFVRWVIVVLIIVFAGHFLGIFDLKSIIGNLI